MTKMTPNTGPQARDLDGILQICGGTQKGVKIAKGVRNFRVHVMTMIFTCGYRR